MMHFSRITLEDPSLARSHDTLANTYGHHQKVWQFFAHDPSARREFLYRFDSGPAGARFHTVSIEPPRTNLPGWLIETRPYDPNVEAGARLRFSLRANPTKRIAEKGQRSDGARHDVVMVRKRTLRDSGAQIHMPSLVQDAGSEWLARQGERNGFSIQASQIRADGYQPHRFRRPRDGQTISMTGIDFGGLLTVTDPEAFRTALHQGIGPAKGFGFGLLLVRRP